jgi:NADH dehydrogenase FAD-containing subunit
MKAQEEEEDMRRIVIVGGGYAGFSTAWKLEKRLRPHEAELVIIDPRPYMTYQPFVPEVAAGSIEARHAAVSLRSHLTKRSDTMSRPSTAGALTVSGGVPNAR